MERAIIMKEVQKNLVVGISRVIKRETIKWQGWAAVCWPQQDNHPCRGPYWYWPCLSE